MAHGEDTDELLRRVKNIMYCDIYEGLVLDVWDLNITSLPKNLPDLTSLGCSFTGVREIPYLPNLTELCCCKNMVTTIPYFPKLRSLSLNGSMVTELPYLPNLEVLHCYNTNIREFPYLPNLRVLNCEPKKKLAIQVDQNNLKISRLRQIERCKTMKEDLMAAAWHPTRVESWLNHGEVIFNMMTGYS
jgi:hypothetical protein